MHVEFLGHRAAGKSTLIRDVRSRLMQRGVSVTDHDFRPTNHIRRLSRLEVAAELIRRPDVLPSVLLGRLSRQKVAALMATARKTPVVRDDHVLLVQEGAVHDSLFLTNDWNAAADVVMSGLPRPDLAIHVTADFETTLARIRQRRRADESNIDEARVREIHRIAERNIRHIARFAPVLTVDTTSSVDTAAAVTDYIARTRQTLPA